MPIYEYACAACGNEFEEWQKMSDPPVRTCPKCKKKKVERLISRTAFQLKGSGWYADLYSSSKPGADGKGDAKAESKSEDKSESKSESKSDSGDATSKSSKETRSASDSSSKSAGKDAGKSSDKASGKKKESSAKKADTRAA